MFCKRVPFPDEVYECKKCSSLICNKSTANRADYCNECGINITYSFKSVSNLLILSLLNELTVKCYWCNDTMLLGILKNHINTNHYASKFKCGNPCCEKDI